MQALLPVISSFLLIFIAELGDKTQLLTLVFCTKYPVVQVLTAISCATALLMGLAVLFGDAISLFIPQIYIQTAAALLFIGFGLWTLFYKESGKNKEEAPKAKGIPFFTVFASFFIAELGDKTQLSAFALSAQYKSALGVWFGATLGMVLANVIAAFIGIKFKKHISEEIVEKVGGIVFLIFGLLAFAGIFI